MTFSTFMISIGCICFVFDIVMWVRSLDDRIDKIEAKIDELLKGTK